MVLTSDEIVAANRESWNEAAARHRAHAQYAALLAGFTPPGFSVPDDTPTGRLPGLSLAGQTVAQPCRNTARPLLSPQHLGAATTHATDFSPVLLDKDRALPAAARVDAPFAPK